MTYVDSVLLDVTEWLCRRFQVATGRTNVWLALQLTNISIIVYFVWAAMYSWAGGVATRTGVGLFCAGLLYVLTQTVFKVPIEAYENAAYLRVSKGLRNPRRIRDALLRIPFLTLSLALWYPILFLYLNRRSLAVSPSLDPRVPDILAYFRLRLPVMLLGYSLIVLTTVVLYLLACDPLPPCPGKLKVWLRGLAPSRVAASESNVRLQRFSA